MGRPEEEEENRGRPGGHWTNRQSLWRGILLSNTAGLVLMAFTRLLAYVHEGAGTSFFVADFVLIPFVMGWIAAANWRDLPVRPMTYTGYTTLNMSIMMALTIFFLREGIVCIVLAAPLLLPFFVLGSYSGKAAFEKHDSRLRVSVVPVVAALCAIDALSPHHFESSRVSEVTINARPEVVWQYVGGYPGIPQPPDYWLWNIGLPAPIRSTTDGAGVGARRTCEFTGGVTFGERITAWEPGRRLAFDVTSQPNHPEIIDHIVLQRGEFVLTANADGTTTLRGTSWYQLNVYPAAYFDWWAQDIIANLHRRVLSRVKQLAEADHH